MNKFLYLKDLKRCWIFLDKVGHFWRKKWIILNNLGHPSFAGKLCNSPNSSHFPPYHHHRICVKTLKASNFTQICKNKMQNVRIKITIQTELRFYLMSIVENKCCPAKDLINFYLSLHLLLFDQPFIT